ncbi:hypothetical protein BH18THE2_BH18THE2_13810 [soil metagenome]
MPSLLSRVTHVINTSFALDSVVLRPVHVTLGLWSAESNKLLLVVLANICDNIAYRHGLHFCCQEVYPNRNQKKV